MILQNLLKSLMTWLMNLALSCYDYVANALLDIFGMNLDVFKENVPVTVDIMNILLAAGWALLIGNLVFQALKGMLSGLGFESESPAILFARTFVFGFLLLASRQICGIAMNMTGTVIELLKIPDAVTLPVPNENDFLFGASWVFVLIVNSVMMWQVLKLFLIIAERYVMMVFLVIVAPLAFAMGGSKQTEDIFKGYARMLGSVCLMVLLNVVMLKLMLSAMGGSDGGPLTVVWLMLLIGIGRLAKKLDEMVSRIGLNTARTGVAMGGGVPGMLAMAAIRMGTKQVGSHISKGSQKFEKDQGGNAGGVFLSGEVNLLRRLTSRLNAGTAHSLRFFGEDTGEMARTLLEQKRESASKKNDRSSFYEAIRRTGLPVHLTECGDMGAAQIILTAQEGIREKTARLMLGGHYLEASPELPQTDALMNTAKPLPLVVCLDGDFRRIRQAYRAAKEKGYGNIAAIAFKEQLPALAALCAPLRPELFGVGWRELLAAVGRGLYEPPEDCYRTKEGGTVHAASVQANRKSGKLSDAEGGP